MSQVPEHRTKLLDLMLKNQQKDGSWIGKDLEADRAGGRYSTAMAVLALTVEYRLLPIYQRGEDGTEPARRRPNSAGDKR